MPTKSTKYNSVEAMSYAKILLEDSKVKQNRRIQTVVMLSFLIILQRKKTQFKAGGRFTQTSFPDPTVRGRPLLDPHLCRLGRPSPTIMRRVIRPSLDSLDCDSPGPGLGLGLGLGFGGSCSYTQRSRGLRIAFSAREQTEDQNTNAYTLYTHPPTRVPLQDHPFSYY